MLSRKTLAIVAVVMVLTGAVTSVAAAVLPPRSVDPSTVPHGTLAVGYPTDVLSVSAFATALSRTRNSNVVLQHAHFAPGQATNWHTHPGPNIVLVAAGSFALTDEHCTVTTYGPGQAFATGLKAHNAVAGPKGADFYSLYLLPSDATALRHDEQPPACASR